MLCRPLRNYLLRTSVIDIPNERSLHSEPVVRGGGIAIAAVVLVLQAAFAANGVLPAREGFAVCGAGLAFVVLGWWDDRRSQSAALRVTSQLFIAGCFLSALAVDTFSTWTPMWFGAFFFAAMLGLVWIVNLYNFMDGADGFAATQALLTMLGSTVLLSVGGEFGLALIAAAVAGACAGFLRWNWSPARMFMGDSGSYFLGFQLAALALLEVNARVDIVPWTILLLPFLVDAGFTLARRIGLRERWWEAHKSHAFQLLALNGWSHRKLSLGLATINLALCWPCALWSFVSPETALLPVLLAAALTAMIWLFVNRRFPAPMNLVEE